MGAIGGLLGVGGGAGGTGFNVDNPVNNGQIQTAYGGVQNSLQSQNDLLKALQGQNGIQNQSQIYNQLQGIINGQGPNPAQAMLNQATGQNVANQAALMAGQRGANQNVGLLARQAAQQGANIQQQAAGQQATMQANQSLGALQNAGNVANTMVGNQIGQTNANTQNQLNEQQNLLNAQTGFNTAQSGMAQTGMKGQQGLIGGVLNSVGGIFAEGGVVGDNSAFQGQSKFGKFLSGVGQNLMDDDNFGPKALESGMTSLGNGIGNLFKPKPIQGNFVGPDVSSNPVELAASKGGEINVALSPGEKVLYPSQVKQVAKGKTNPMQAGGDVPGKAKVKGDSLKNDTFRTKLPAGSIVIPRSVVNSEDPVRGSADFVRAILAKKRIRA